MRLLLFMFPFVIFLLSCHHVTEEADVIYYNGTLWTGDSSNPTAKAIALKGNLIVYVGDRYQDYAGQHTRLVDLQGKFVTPGFIDNHSHFLNGGYNLASVQLRHAKTPSEFIAILSEYCRRYPDDRWIQGGDWDHENWGGELPRKEWIDSVTGNHPLFISRYDGHMAFANSKALQLAGINGSTKPPPGGEIVKDEHGHVTGILKDAAMDLMYHMIPDPSSRELDEYFQAASRYVLSNGVTQVHDMGTYGGWLDRQTYQKAYQQQQLSLRIYSFAAISTWKKLDSFCKKNGKGDDMLRWGGLKGFVDGSLGSTTAWFYQPYLDAPNSRGLQVTDTNLLRRWVVMADSAGLHIAIHAIGDHANDFILGVFAEAATRNPGIDHRFRVEHAQHLRPEAIAMFSRLHVIPSMQPYHAIDDGRWAAKRLDEARLRGTYAFKSLIDSGARLTFGSDWPVAPATPLEGIYAAVTRRTLDDKNPGGWYPGQKLSVEQALRCYTVNNAYAGFQEDKLGILKKGMLADIVIMDQNLLAIPPEKIRDVQVETTIVNGKEVFRRDSR
jgi:predicted amidohydrolase YtcJ